MLVANGGNNAMRYPLKSMRAPPRFSPPVPIP